MGSHIQRDEERGWTAKQNKNNIKKEKHNSVILPVMRIGGMTSAKVGPENVMAITPRGFHNSEISHIHYLHNALCVMVNKFARVTQKLLQVNILSQIE